MSDEALTEAMLLLQGLRLEIAQSLVLKLSSVPRYGLVEALAEYPWLADANWEPVRSFIRNYRDQKGG